MKKLFLSFMFLGICAVGMVNANSGGGAGAAAQDEWTYRRGGWVYDHTLDVNVFHCPSSNATNICRYPAR